MRALQHRVHDLVSLKLGVDGVHVDPVHHDVGDSKLAEIEYTAQHVAVELHHTTFLVMQFDSAAQLVVSGQDVGIVAHPGAEQAQHMADQQLHGIGHRRKHGHDETQDGRDCERQALRIDDGVSLRQHFREHDDKNGHHESGVNDPGFAEELEKEAGGERGRGDVDQVVAEQECADQLLPGEQEMVHDASALVAVLLKRMHAGARSRGHSRLGA